MRWNQIRDRYLHKWLLVEATEAHSSEGPRFLDELTVVQEYPNGKEAMRGYLDVHRRSPDRELYGDTKQAPEEPELHPARRSPSQSRSPMSSVSRSVCST